MLKTFETQVGFICCLSKYFCTSKSFVSVIHLYFCMQQSVQKSKREHANLPKQIFLYKQILKNDTRFCHKNMLLVFAPPKTRFPFLLCTASCRYFCLRADRRQVSQKWNNKKCAYKTYKQVQLIQMMTTKWLSYMLHATSKETAITGWSVELPNITHSHHSKLTSLTCCWYILNKCW